MLEPIVQQLETEIIQRVTIFVDNDAFAFFNALNTPKSPTPVKVIDEEPLQKLFGQLYNFMLLRETHYFRTGGYNGEVRTVSVTTPCIVICAFTKYQDGRIRSSGVYHANTFSPTSLFQNRLYKLVNTVRVEPNQAVTIKAAGGHGNGKRLQELRNDIRHFMSQKSVEVYEKNVLLGGNSSYRVTKFYPQTGELVTYYLGNSKQKTIL